MTARLLSLALLAHLARPNRDAVASVPGSSVGISEIMADLRAVRSGDRTSTQADCNPMP